MESHVGDLFCGSTMFHRNVIKKCKFKNFKNLKSVQKEATVLPWQSKRKSIKISQNEYNEHLKAVDIS